MAKISVTSLCALAFLAVGCASSPQLELERQPQPQPQSQPPLGAATAAGGPSTEQALLGTWRLTRVNSQPTLPGIGLSFDPNGMVRGTMTCGNSLLAYYTVLPTSIVFRQTLVTERGCDDATPLHQAAEKTIRGLFSAHLSPDHRTLYLRGGATLGFTRSVFLAETAAVRMIKESVKVGDAEMEAVSALVAARFACRPLTGEEFGRISPEHVKEWTCFIETEQAETGHKLVYAGLAVDRQGKLLRVGTGSYPVVYRNLRVDHLGRTIVVNDANRRPSQSIMQHTAYGDALRYAGQADAVVLAQVVVLSNLSPGQDRMTTQIDVIVREVFKGRVRPGQAYCVRTPLGSPSGGRTTDESGSLFTVGTPRALRTGDLVIIFLQRRHYEAQARRLGGTARHDCSSPFVGASRVRDQKIQPDFPFVVPTTIREFRKLLRDE